MRLVFVLAFLLTAASLQSHALSAPLQAAHDSVIYISQMKFQPETASQGDTLGWQELKFDDSTWPTLTTDSPWQKQGFPDVHTSGWYRFTFQAPAKWQGSKITLQSDGIQDEYDLYVNGTLVRHFGSVTLPVDYEPTQTEIETYLNYGTNNLIAIRATEHANDDGGGISHRLTLRRMTPLDRSKLPSPILDSHPELVDLYWQSWRMAWEKVSFGTSENGFMPAYMEEGYSDAIYQWDSVFISRYGMYGRRLFPAMPTLDNFYSKQEPDGYIQRIYSKTNGQKLVQEAADISWMTNPPIFAWAELDYYELTGDTSRLVRVVPILEKYDTWLTAHLASPKAPGLFTQVPFESGMDNMPRPNADQGGWIDESAQMALAAKCLERLNQVLGRTKRASHWLNVYARRKEAINQKSWSAADGIYYDVDNNASFTGVKHIGAMWTLLSEVATTDRAAALIKHLKNPAEFYRPHLFPALAASDPSYSPTASYWQGGVWAPTNYMTIHGLVKYGYADFAYEAALNHLEHMWQVYSSHIDMTRVDPNEINDDAHTIWECYNPDLPIPCTRADAYYFGRQNFAGWTGIGPIALMIEQLVGLDIKGAENKVIWNLRDDGRVGLTGFELTSGNIVSLVAEKRDGKTRQIAVNAQKPFILEVRSGGLVRRWAVPGGRSRVSLTPQSASSGGFIRKKESTSSV